MNNDSLQSYLNDHLAGATMGLELIEFLISLHAADPQAQFFKDLHREVAADKAVLHELIEDLDFPPSTVRQTAAWLLEKTARIKFLLAGPGKGTLGELEALDTLATGIEGKAALWAALSVIVDPPAPLRDLDLVGLQERAREQRAQVEAHRLEAARSALTHRPG